MKFEEKTAIANKEILYNDHYVAIPYNYSDVAGDKDGVLVAGTIIPQNDETAIGILLYDVNKNENPNGAVVIHGFINEGKLETEPANTAKTALSGIVFMKDGKPD